MIALSPVAMLTISLRPMSPRAAPTTSGGRPELSRLTISDPSKHYSTLRSSKLTSLSDLDGIRVLIVKRSDEVWRLTSNIDLVVNVIFIPRIRSLEGEYERCSTCMARNMRKGQVKRDTKVHLRRLTDSRGHAVDEQSGKVSNVRDGESPAGVPGSTNSSVIIE